MDSSKFMHLAPQLLVGLLVEPPIFGIDGNDPGNHLNKIHLLISEIMRLH